MEKPIIAGDWYDSWIDDLTESQKDYLLKRYGTFKEALAVYAKAKRSGMIDFEILEQ